MGERTCGQVGTQLSEVLTLFLLSENKQQPRARMGSREHFQRVLEKQHEFEAALGNKCASLTEPQGVPFGQRVERKEREFPNPHSRCHCPRS